MSFDTSKLSSWFLEHCRSYKLIDSGYTYIEILDSETWKRWSQSFSWSSRDLWWWYTWRAKICPGGGSKKKKAKDMEHIWKKMDLTFSFRRKEIVEVQPVVSEIQDRWPAMFLEKQARISFNYCNIYYFVRLWVMILSHYLVHKSPIYFNQNLFCFFSANFFLSNSLQIWCIYQWTMVEKSQMYPDFKYPKIGL